MILGKNFSNLKVILVEPSGPLNVGSVARYVVILKLMN